MHYKKFFLFLLLPLSFLSADLAPEREPEILVNNRILARVNGKSISVMDVMKKMDVFLSRHYPDHASSNAARLQFFDQSWRQTLRQMVDNELILADAEKLEVKIDDADVRQRIHNRFGPNVMASLDDLGISLEEAWNLVYTEMVVQRMSYYRFQSKAVQKVGPKEIKEAFTNYLVTNPPKEEWKYQVLSIRGVTENIGNVYAKKAHALIRNEPLPFEELATLLKEEHTSEDVTINVSREYTKEDKDLSASHKKVLTTLKPNSYSEPIPQVSRADKSIVHRIFFLMNHSRENAASFDDVADKLQDELIQKQIEVEMPKYLTRLRNKFNFEDNYLDTIPSDFVPFSSR